MNLKPTHKTVKHVLPFKTNALKPYLSVRAINLHFGKHHKTYIDKYNKELIKYKDLQSKTLEQVLFLINRELKIGNFTRLALFQNGAQAFNHNFFWHSLAIDTEPIKDFPITKQLFVDTGMSKFGSGWMWIVKLPDSKIDLCVTQNEESPLFSINENNRTIIYNEPIESSVPMATYDLWEHSYYPDYTNRKKEYLENIFDHLINWHFLRRKL